jgi:hypothetical protein
MCKLHNVVLWYEILNAFCENVCEVRKKGVMLIK